MKNLSLEIAKSVKEVLPGPGPFPLHEPSLDNADIESVCGCVESTFVSTVGQDVGKFEKQIAIETSSQHVIAVVNGTAALHISLLLAGILPGEEVLVPSFTFVATANAVRYCNAIPHFVDVEKDGVSVDPIRLRQYLEKICILKSHECRNRQTGARIRALVPVHVFGHPAKMDELESLANEFHLVLVEDAAESLGSFWRGKHTGISGQTGTISFNGNKIITTGGGGAILTQDESIAAQARHLTTTAKTPHPWRYDHDKIGYNYRLPNLNAALGCSQISKLKKLITAKRRLFQVYEKAIQKYYEVCLILNEPKNSQSNFWLQTLILKNPYHHLCDGLLEAFHSLGIYARPAWTPLHCLLPFQEFPRMEMRETENMARRVINLPSSPKILLN